MKTFTVNGYYLTEGLRVRQTEGKPDCVFLGEEGRGRHYEKLTLHKQNPPEIAELQDSFGGSERLILDAHPVKITLAAKEDKAEKVFYVLAKARNENDNRVLVRINTCQFYTKGTNGFYEWIGEHKGQTLIRAHGAWGDAGRIGQYQDDLVVMDRGDCIKVTPSGGYKTTEYVLKLLENGELVFEKWQDYEAAIAQENGIEEEI